MESTTALVRLAPQTDPLPEAEDLESAAAFFEALSEAARRARPDESSDEPYLYRTPFWLFMNALLSNNPAKIMTNGGAAEWSGPPIETLAAQGLWPVMMKLAEKQRMHLGTEKDVLQHIAPKLEQMIGIGMLLQYGSPEHAAVEFRKRVIEKITTVDASAHALAQIVQLPVGKFFADMLKAIAPARESVLNNVQRLREANLGPGRSVYINEYSSMYDLPAIETLYHIGKQMDPQSGAGINFRDLRHIPQIGDAIMAHTLALSAVRKLPVRISDFTGHDVQVKLHGFVIQYHWLATQIVLAANRAPVDEGSIGTESYAAMILRTQEQSDDKILRAVFQRFRKRGTPQTTWTDEECVFLEAEIRSLIRLIKHMDPHRIHDAILTYYEFTRAFVETHALSPKEAFKLATSKEPRRTKILANPALISKISASLDWSGMIMENIAALMLARILPAEDIARGMARMTGQYNRADLGEFWEAECAVIRAEFEVDYDTPSAREILSAHGILRPKPVVQIDYAAHPEKIPADRKHEIMLSFFAKEDDFNQLPKHRVQAIVKTAIADPAFAQDFFGRIEHRAMLYIFFLDEFFSSTSRAGNSITDDLYRAFVAAVGERLLLKFSLASEVALRMGDFKAQEEKIKATPKIDRHTPWTAILDHAGSHFDPLTDVPTLSKKEIRRLLKTKEFSEAAIFRWLHAGEADLEQLLKAYLAGRDRYFHIVKKLA